MSPQPFALSHLLEPAHAHAREVAFGRAGKRSLADLRHDVAALAAEVAARGQGRWLLHTDDSYAAAVGFLALAHAGCTAVLLPNRQPDTLRRLAPECVGAVLEPGEAVPGVDVVAPFARSALAPAALMQLDPHAEVAELLTSGTTGAGARVPKRLSHLDDEVATLEARFGAVLPAEARIFATVSHQHIYGLLFRVLWPLAAGRPFCADTPLHPQELLPRMRETAACALVASPVHLKRLASLGSLRDASGVCRAVFSSGGPLDADTAHAMARALGPAPFEIFGSTETGGVATRQRGGASDGDGTDEDETWLPLPGVELAAGPEDGRLYVTSAFVSCGERGPDGRHCFAMGDRVLLRAGGGFALLGRADRVVKVGEKRLALPEMERELMAHPAVAEAALCVAPRGGESRVHAVVVPSAAGHAALAEAGRRAFGAQLGQHLARVWDRVLLPRAWRFVAALPRNAQGKLPAAALRALFEHDADTPSVVREERAADRIAQTLQVPVDLAGIEGHFPGEPVVPGVMQLGWALDAARTLLGEPPRVRRFDAVKFPTLLRPGSEVELEVQWLAASARLRFSLRCAGEITASGRCTLAPREDA